MVPFLSSLCSGNYGNVLYITILLCKHDMGTALPSNNKSPFFKDFDSLLTADRHMNKIDALDCNGC